MHQPPPAGRLSQSAEDYLEAIGTLCQKNGQAQVSDIAEMLHVKKPSVTVAIRQLHEQGLVDYRSYAPVTLTEKGKIYAEKVMQAHSILTHFLRIAADMCPERADAIACELEHCLTYEEITRIEELYPKDSQD